MNPDARNNKMIYSMTEAIVDATLAMVEILKKQNLSLVDISQIVLSTMSGAHSWAISRAVNPELLEDYLKIHCDLVRKEMKS